MILQEIVRYYKSKFSMVLIIGLTLIIVSSYYSTYLQKKEWEQVLHSGASDVNLEKVVNMISGYTGTYYFECFLFSSDFKIIAVFILLIGFGILFGSNMLNSLQSNYGTMIVTRMTYKKYLFKVTMAQVLYMSSFVIGYFFIIFILTLILFKGGVHFSTNSIVSNVSTLKYVSLFIISIFQMLILIILLILISTVSSLFLKNIYAIQILPFLIVNLTYFIASFLGNISKEFTFFTSFIIINNVLTSVESSYISSSSLFYNILTGSIFIVACLTIYIFMYRANTKKYGQDFII